jgi:thymidine phosphorylase
MAKFNYERFRGYLDSFGKDAAMSYYNAFYEGKDKMDSLQEKLGIVARLEEEENILGINVMNAPGQKCKTEDLVDYVVGFIVRSVDMVNRRDELPGPSPTPLELRAA